MNIAELTTELAQDELGAVVVMYNKNGEAYKAADGSDASVTVTGTDAKAYREQKHANQRDYLKRHVKPTPASITADRVKLAAAAVIAWNGWEADGVALPCTSEHVRGLLRVEHILEQVEQGIAAHASFFLSESAS